MLVGYMRVSSDGDRQTTALQRDALLAAGVDDRHLYEDKAMALLPNIGPPVMPNFGPPSPRNLRSP